MRKFIFATILLFLGLGQMSAYYYLPSDFEGGNWDNTGYSMGDGNSITFYAVNPISGKADNKYYFKLYLTGWSGQSGDNLIEAASGDALDSYGHNSGDAMWLVFNQIADVTIYVSNTSTNKLTIVANPSQYFIKYPWDGTNWTYSGMMVSNLDGTYSVKGAYHGKSYDHARRGSDGGAGSVYHDNGATIVGDTPSDGDDCIFTLKPNNDYALEIRKTSSVTKTNYIYFDNTQSGWSDSYIYFAYGHPTYTQIDALTAVDNTKLYYGVTADTWDGGVGYYGVFGSGEAFSSGSWGQNNLANAAHYSLPYTTSLNLESGYNYIVGKASATNGTAITITKTGNSASALNTTQTIQYALSMDNGSTYKVMSSGSTPGAISISAYKFVNDTYNSVINTSNSQSISDNSTGTYIASVPAAYTGATTLTATAGTGYTFVGWKIGTSEDAASSPCYPTAATTYTARFKANVYTVTLNTNGGTINEGDVTSYTYGIGATLPMDVTRDGYAFLGWYDNSSLTGSAVTTISTSATGNKEYWAKWAVNIPQASAGTYIPIGTVPATSGDKTPAACVALVGCRVDGNYGAEAYTSFTVGNTNGTPMSITISLNATEAANYLFSFKSGNNSGTATVSLSLKNSSDEVIWNNGGNNVSISNTGGWTLTEAHTFLLGDLAAGTYTLTITGVSKSGSYYGNFGNFCFHTPTTLFMPYDDTDAHKLNVKMATTSGLNISGTYLSSITANSYADEIYMYITDAGYYQVYAGYGYATAGTDQFTITITDMSTGTAEVNAQNYTVTSSMRYIMKNRISTGWKKIRLDHPITPASGSFRMEKMYFIPVQDIPNSNENLLDVTMATVSGMKINGTYLTEITAGSYADDIYMEVPQDGYYQVFAEYGYSTVGSDQFTITITDMNTDVAEVNAKNYILTDSKKYLMSDYITAGLKKIRLDHPGPISDSRYRLQKMYFIPIQTMPDSPSNLLDVTNATVSGLSISGNYLSNITVSSYADDIYVNFENGGYFQLHSEYGWATAGTDNFTITITDVNSSTDEVAKNFVVASTSNYLITDYISAGLKKIRLYYPGPTITSKFRFQDTYFDQIPNLPLTGTSTLNLNQLGAVFNDCRYEDANANIGYVKNGGYADNYIVYNESAGIYSLKTNISWYNKGGTFKITITDIATYEVEVDTVESSTITGTGNVELTLNDRLTTGLKKMRFDFVKDGESDYLFNINNVSFYTLTLAYDDNGGSGGPGSEFWAPSATNYLSTTEPTRAGYTFAGWNEAEDGSGATTYAAGDAYTMPLTDNTLYAVWAPDLTFTGGTKDHETEWNTAANWSPASVPTIYSNVTIEAPVEVNVANAKAKSVVIYNNGNTKTGKLTIGAGKALAVATTIQKTADGSTKTATTAADIILESDGSNGTGALITGEESTNTVATVHFYTKARKDASDHYVNQYFGIPFASTSKYSYYGSYLRVYDDNTWASLSSDNMTPWTAYRIMRAEQDDGETYVMDGALILPGTSGTQELSLTRSGDNMFANSWTAPIDIASLAGENNDYPGFDGVDPTIYIFNAGSADDYGSGTIVNKSASAGQWIALPVSGVKTDASDYDLAVIPSQQAFLVQTEGEGSTHTLTLDYNDNVYVPATEGVDVVATRAPKRTETREVEIMRLNLSATSGLGDRVLFYLHEDFSNAYDRGWEAYKLPGSDFAPQLCAYSPLGEMAIAATNDVEGTVLGFYSGTQDNSYTFSFGYDGSDIWYLNDLMTQQSTRIAEGYTYHFTAAAGSVAESRFVISHTPIAQVPTELSTTDVQQSGARKVMIKGILYIVRDGRIYTVDGMSVNERKEVTL